MQENFLVKYFFAAGLKALLYCVPLPLVVACGAETLACEEALGFDGAACGEV